MTKAHNETPRQEPSWINKRRQTNSQEVMDQANQETEPLLADRDPPVAVAEPCFNARFRAKGRVSI